MVFSLTLQFYLILLSFLMVNNQLILCHKMGPSDAHIMNTDQYHGPIPTHRDLH